MCSSRPLGWGASIAAAQRTEGTAPQLQFPNSSGYYHQTLTHPPAAVWIRLGALAIRDPGASVRTRGDGLDMTGERPGWVTHWVPTVAGDWMARCHYSVAYADGREPLYLADQLVPGYAVRPRGARALGGDSGA